MRKLENFCKYFALVLLFTGLIFLLVVGIWENQVLRPLNQLIHNTPEYFWMESLRAGLFGGAVIIGLLWAVLLAFRVERENN